MTIAHRCLDEMHVEATGCRDRHQGIAARDAHRDRLENLAGIDAERPGLGDRGIGLLVRDVLERDAVGLEMLCYLRHHLTPHLAGEPSITPIRPRDPKAVTGPPGAAGGRVGAAAPGGARQLAPPLSRAPQVGGDLPLVARACPRPRGASNERARELYESAWAWCRRTVARVPDR